MTSYANTKKNSFPHPTCTKPFWIEEAQSPLAKHRTTEELPEEVDVVIIGSGYAGTSVAFNLLVERETTKKVLLLEARDVCSGATGRNGGHVKSYYHIHQNKYNKLFGEKIAAELALFEHFEMDKVQKIVEKYNIDCNFERKILHHTYDQPELIQQAMNDYYIYLNNPLIPQELKDCVQIYFDSQAREVSDHDKAIASVASPTASVWPYKLICGMLEKAIEKGLNLQTNTCVTDLRKLDGDKWLVSTPRGSVITQKLVIATNAYTRAIMPEYHNKIVPVKGVVSHLKAATEDTKPLKDHYYHTYAGDSDYVTSPEKGSIIVGGGGKPEDMLDTTDDSVFPSEVGEYMRDYAKKMYRSLANETYTNDYTWTGCMGYSTDSFPYVGDLAKYGRPNTFILAGFSGHGMPRIWSCGVYIADLVLDGLSTTRLPEPFLVSIERLTSADNPYMCRESK